MNRPAITPPYYPIIYVRGFAMGQSAVEEAVEDPYCGFNSGSTKYRQRWTGDIHKLIFESPVVRLMKEYGYRDLIDQGSAMGAETIPDRPLLIYRYYDTASEDFGDARRREIEENANGLGAMILDLQQRLCGDDEDCRRAFKVIVVAHSMGGLITRCLLQNPRIPSHGASVLVDKVFTYGTPHNGIDLRLLGNVPSVLAWSNTNNFNREHMRRYLDLPNDKPANSLGGRFDPNRFFCLVGTNADDYPMQASSVAVGPFSDGLVRTENATVHGPWDGRERIHAPRAYVHRSHSGPYGLVNSEAGYQNLTRFCFGDLRVDAVLEIDDIRLPPGVHKAYRAGRKVRASYHFEVVSRVRGARWDLHCRTQEHHSAIFRTFDDLFKPERLGREQPRHPHLFSAFLSSGKKVARGTYAHMAVDLRIVVPDYEVDGFLWMDDHYEGGYLFRDKLNLGIKTKPESAGHYLLAYGFDSRTPNRAPARTKSETQHTNLQVFTIPIVNRSRPGISARLRIEVRPWG